MTRVLSLVLTNSLWLVGLGLMLASSGIDGAYMARWMTDLPGIGGAAVLGYVLNTTSDIASMVLTYWYGRLRQEAKNTKRYKLSGVLIVGEIVAVTFSWLFGWRQLRIVLAPIEGAATVWVAPVAAGFIPLLLAFIGYAQALLAGNIERTASAAPAQSGAEPTQQEARQPQRQPEANATEEEKPTLPEYAHATVAHFAENPTATYVEAADALDCSPRTVSNHMNMALSAGIAHRNGDRWEVKL